MAHRRKTIITNHLAVPDQIQSFSVIHKQLMIGVNGTPVNQFGLSLGQ
jgi:hypothetical protein